MLAYEALLCMYFTCTLLHLNCFSCRRTVLWDIIFSLLFSDHPPVCPPCDNEMNTDVVLEHMCASEFGNVSLLSVYFVNAKNDQSNVFKLLVYMIRSKKYENILYKMLCFQSRHHASKIIYRHCCFL